MGVDTIFYGGLGFNLDDTLEDFDIEKEWEKFLELSLMEDHESSGWVNYPWPWNYCPWDIDFEENQVIRNNGTYRAYVYPFAEWLCHICHNFFAPNNIRWFFELIPFHTSWGDSEAGVIRFSNESLMIVKVAQFCADHDPPEIQVYKFEEFHLPHYEKRKRTITNVPSS
jgi:hypothetical protein